MASVAVTGAAVVLPTIDGRESYFYRGAVLPVDGFTEKGLEHAKSLGLISDVDEADEADGEEKPAGKAPAAPKAPAGK